jgi:hypothetical protein
MASVAKRPVKPVAPKTTIRLIEARAGGSERGNS